jgi:hypothetical protein
MFDKTNYSKYEDSLDELEKACINETLVIKLPRPVEVVDFQKEVH